MAEMAVSPTRKALSSSLWCRDLSESSCPVKDQALKLAMQPLSSPFNCWGLMSMTSTTLKTALKMNFLILGY